jgi:hypothetical protein
MDSKGKGGTVVRFRMPVTLLSLVAMVCFGCAPDSPTDGPIDSRSSSGPIGQQDVTFFGAGKVARYQQHSDGSLESMGPLFFAEIFIAERGKVTDASVKFPPPLGDVRDLLFRHSESDEIGDVMYLSGTAHDIDELDQKFPPGEYTFSFKTGNGDIVSHSVNFKNRQFAQQPLIIFMQNEKQIAIDQVDPAVDLVITWPPFEEGRADENGVLDDLIFVAIDSCTVEDIVHSGRPFEKEHYLTYLATEYVVSANTLQHGQKYSMYVEHAILPDTHNESGIPAFATLAASTYMDFTTTGETDPNYCNK